jgi:hypothetical protein
MMFRLILNLMVYLSFIWNLALVMGVVCQADYALLRAASGQFSVFPIYVRVLYVLITLLVLFQIYSFWLLSTRREVKRNWVLIGFYVSMISAVLNGLSYSPLERWNVIPALIVALGFYVYRGNHFNIDNNS